jgi:hypothetical protein
MRYRTIRSKWDAENQIQRGMIQAEKEDEIIGSNLD